jgi:amino acid transporter
MNFYWVYDLPNWLFFVITVAVFVIFALLGAFLFSNKLEKKLGLTKEHNSIVSTFLGLSGVFYGITLGLIAVGTFDNFNSTEDKVNNESSSLASLYRDVSILENPEKDVLKNTLKKYTHYVINDAWPLQKKGLVPKGGTALVDTFQMQIANYTPTTDKDKIIYAEVFDQFNVFVEKRRLRLNAVNASLPSTIWLILFLGAFVNIALTWLLVINNKKLDIAINILSSALLGALIFLIAAMDNPFRGEYCVTADSFQLLLDGLMK